MVRKKDIVDNELIKEIISMRLDTVWKMIDHERRGTLPGVTEEGATGKFDNKGAIFIPGGLVQLNVDENPIEYKRKAWTKSEAFRKKVRWSMAYDNATLLYQDGIAVGVNLDSGFFSRAARRINSYKKAAFRRKKKIGAKLPKDISSDDIIRSHCPSFFHPPYGARTRISTCVAVGLIDPPMYFAFCKTEFNLSAKQSRDFACRMDLAQDPVLAEDGAMLYPPYIVVCHDTRYKDNSYTGLTRILGIGKFGNFATITFEKVNKTLVAEFKRKNQELTLEDLFAEYDENKIACILRVYAPTSVGKRSAQYDLHILSPKKDLGLDLDRIEAEAKNRYWSSPG